MVYIKGGLLEVLIPLNLLALPSSPSAPAVLPAGLSERGAWAGGGGRLRARHIGARRAPREGGAVNSAPGGFRPCNVDSCKCNPTELNFFVNPTAAECDKVRALILNEHRIG